MNKTACSITILSVITLATPFVGCAVTSETEPAGTVQPDPAETTQSLNGTVNFAPFPTSGACATKQTAFKTKFRNVFQTILVPNVVQNYQPMVECLKEALLYGEEFNNSQKFDVTYPELIMERMRQNVPTTVGCANNKNGCSYDGPEEAFTCDAGFAQKSDDETAAYSLHEISHRLYAHPDSKGSQDYSLSVLEQLYQCIISVREVQRGAQPQVQPNGPRRSSFSFETTLSPVGTEGGVPREANMCGANEMVAGFWGSYDSSSLGNIAPICKRVGANARSYLPVQGQELTSEFVNLCEEGEVAVGVWGNASDTLHSIGNICERETDVQNRLQEPQYFDPRQGVQTRLEWQRKCPVGMALKGVRVRAGYYIDRLELVCQDLAYPTDATTHSTDMMGYNARYFNMEWCQGRGVMTGLTTKTGSLVDRIGGVCTGVSAPRASRVATLLSGTDYPLGAHGGAGGDPNQSELCPQGAAIVGITSYLDTSADTIAGVQAICADMVAWQLHGQGTSFAPLAGRETDVPLSQTCPLGEFAVGLDTDTGKLLEGLALKCRRFE